MSGFQLPNTTPVPNDIINGWMHRLKGSELKVLLTVVRKTLGWVVDTKTGMRKKEDWLSYSQLKKITGLGSEALSSAIDNLCQIHKLIQIRDKDGNTLNTRKKRQVAGRRRLSFFYRVNLTTLKNTSIYFENRNSTTSKIETVLLRKSKTTKATLTKATLTKGDTLKKSSLNLGIKKERRPANRLAGKPYSKASWLLELSDEDVTYFQEDFTDMTADKIRREARSGYYWQKDKGKWRKNNRSFLRNWLKKSEQWDNKKESPSFHKYDK